MGKSGVVYFTIGDLDFISENWNILFTFDAIMDS